jgi:hypothetical protein
VRTECPTCGGDWLTEVDDDLPRDALVIRQRHRDQGVQRYVSREILAMAAIDVFPTTLEATTTALAKATQCLEFRPEPPKPLWQRVNDMGHGPIFADPSWAEEPVGYDGFGAPLWSASPA